MRIFSHCALNAALAGRSYLFRQILHIVLFRSQSSVDIAPFLCLGSSRVESSSEFTLSMNLPGLNRGRSTFPVGRATTIPVTGPDLVWWWSEALSNSQVRIMKEPTWTSFIIWVVPAAVVLLLVTRSDPAGCYVLQDRN